MARSEVVVEEEVGLVGMQMLEDGLMPIWVHGDLLDQPGHLAVIKGEDWMRESFPLTPDRMVRVTPADSIASSLASHPRLISADQADSLVLADRADQAIRTT